MAKYSVLNGSEQLFAAKYMAYMRLKKTEPGDRTAKNVSSWNNTERRSDMKAGNVKWVRLGDYISQKT